MSPDDPRHGTHAGKAAHQKIGELPCVACRAAATEYEDRRRKDALLGRPRRVPCVGTARRIQALAALGYTFASLGDMVGQSHGWAYVLAHPRGATVTAGNAARVAALYDRLCMTPAPTGTPAERRDASYARSVAVRNGWVPPLAWDDIDDPNEQPTVDGPAIDELDPVALDRVIAGDYSLLDDIRLLEGPDIRSEVCRRWWASGRSMADLGRRTGWRTCRYFKVSEEALSA